MRTPYSERIYWKQYGKQNAYSQKNSTYNKKLKKRKNK